MSKLLYIIGVLYLFLLPITFYPEWDPVQMFEKTPLDQLNKLKDPNYLKLKTKVKKTLTGSWCSEEKIDLLMDIVLLSGAKNCAEIGSFTGSTLIPIAAALKFASKGHVIAIEPFSNLIATQYLPINDPNKTWWQQVDMAQARATLHKRIKSFKLTKQIKLMETTSETAIQKINSEIDFLHLDGDSSETTSLNDVMHYLPKVKIGGYILLSNCLITHNGEIPKTKSLLVLFEKCEFITDIDMGNSMLFKKTHHD